MHCLAASVLFQDHTRIMEKVLLAGLNLQKYVLAETKT